jgi:serine phosphatase RsbU (regulator of sigma subunit)
MRRASATVALLDAIVAHAPVGLGFWDLQLRLRHVNAELARMAGSESEAACLGRTPADVLGDLGVEMERLLAGVVATQQAVVTQTITGATPAEPLRLREWIGAYFPVFGELGALMGVGALVREVHDQREGGEARQRALQQALSARAAAETQRARTAFVAHAGARMATSMDATQALRRLARAAVPEAADWCMVSMADRDGRLETVAVAHADREREPLLWALTARRTVHVDEPFGPAIAMRRGRPLVREVVDDRDPVLFAAGDEEHLRQLREVGIGSVLVVPLDARQRPIGAITLAYADSGRRYGADDVAMAQALGAWAALHVENARVYAERSHIASALQEGLQPAGLPDVPGLDVAVRFRPAGAHNAVGGDFYDVFEAADGRWAAVVGDVSGKGADAAALTGLARHTFFAGALQGGDGSANLRLLNEALLRRSGPEGFCTAVAVDIEPRTSSARPATVRIANGGHPAPVVLRADGRLEETVASGTLIGAVETVSLDTEDVVLEPGDALVLFTDGAIELRGDDPADGARVLRWTLRRQRGRSAEEITAAVEAAVVAAAGGALHDDLVVLAIRAVA